MRLALGLEAAMSLTSRLAARLRDEFGKTFRSLRHPNFLIYSSGQLVSMTGTWMRTMALSWITYELTHSALLLGLVGLCTNVPVLILSLFGGMVADRYDRRRILVLTQWFSMAFSAVLTLLIATDSLSTWMILLFSAASGIVSAFEVPSRQAFVSDLVHGQDMVNAISINSVIFNTTRVIGPALGAIALAGLGATVCFALDTLSFVAAIYTLRQLKMEPKRRPEGEAKTAMSIMGGLRFAFGTADIRNILILTVFTSFFGFQFSALLPVFVTDVFHASASALGFLAAASAVGALGSSLVLASRGKPAELHRNICVASIGVGVTLLLFSFSRSLWLSAFIELFIGVFISMQMNSVNSFLQLKITDDVRGRIMSIYSMILLGAVPFGSVVIGSLADHVGAPLAVAACAVACMGAGVFYVTRGSKGD
jgi:MFS family permease